ncbi:MAG: hypothetical protein KF797_09790 [Flavobacteriales bacterium]|nr:hypothetical protein [Flavobacteriales bacterium]
MAAHTERERLERLLRGQADLLQEVHLLLGAEQKHDDILRASVLGSMGERPVHITGADPDRIYHRDSIRALCIRYRLRFLPGGLFKGTLPNTAIHALRALERKSPAPLTGFMVMAPASRFKLCDSEVDPLLFVALGNDRYYLVHKWGRDLSPMRAVLNWPLRNVASLSATVLVLACVLALLIPTALVTSLPDAAYWGAHRVFAMVWSAAVCASFTVFGWFAFFGQFSAEAWNSRYFN